MAKLLETLIPLLSSIALLMMMLANKAVSQSETTTFSFDSFSVGDTDLTFEGDAHVPPSTSIVRLTKTDASGKPETSSAGRVVYSKPVIIWESTGQLKLETTIIFSIAAVDKTPADGITFFIAPVNSTRGIDGSGGNFGIFDSSSGTNPSLFAVEFDIYQNQWDPSYHHIGIDINSRVSVKVAEFDIPLVGQQVTARITYEEASGLVTVDVKSGTAIFPPTTYITALNSILPQQVEVGISASTGAYVAIHDVHAWHFNSTILRTNSAVDDDVGIRQIV